MRKFLKTLGPGIDVAATGMQALLLVYFGRYRLVEQLMKFFIGLMFLIKKRKKRDRTLQAHFKISEISLNFIAVYWYNCTRKMEV